MKLQKNDIYNKITELLSYKDKPKSFHTVKNWASEDHKLLHLLINTTLLNMNGYKTIEDT